jgi:hypothetical protein
MMRCRFLFAAAIGVIQFISTAAVAVEGGTTYSGGTAKRPIAQKCLEGLEAFDDQLSRVGFGVLLYNLPAVDEVYGLDTEPTPRRKIRALHDAAAVYAYAGDEQLCEQTLASMRAIYDEHQKLLGNEADDRNARTAWRRAHLSRSKSVAEMGHLMRTSILVGSEIRNLKDQKLGNIADIVVNPAKQEILYVIASRGGFLGFGEKLVAVRWGDLRATEDQEVYVLDVEPKALEAAPRLDRQNLAQTADPGWQQALARYWDGILKK